MIDFYIKVKPFDFFTRLLLKVTQVIAHSGDDKEK